LYSDPVSDMLTRIRNANMVGRDRVDIPASKMKRRIAQILKQEGFIRDFDQVDNGPQKTLRVYLKYGPDKERVISGIQRVSRPGLRVYAKGKDVPQVRSGLGITIVSTSSGLMTDKRARKEGVGGEVVCQVW